VVLTIMGSGRKYFVIGEIIYRKKVFVLGQEAIVILLMLMPGLVAMYVDKNISGSFTKNNSSYEWIFKALAFNIPTFTFTWFSLWGINKILVLLKLTSIWDLNSLVFIAIKLQSLRFVILYVIISLFIGVASGYIIAGQRKEGAIFYRFFNWLRKSQGKADMLGAISPWDKCFYNREQPVIEIIKSDGTSVKGFLRDFSLGDEPKELTLDHLDVVENWDEYLDKVKSVYYHLDSNTLIKIYDTSEYLAKLDEMGL